MSKSLWPFIVCKAVGGILTVVGCGYLLFTALPRRAGLSSPWTILMAIVAAVGLAAFMAAGREITKRESAAPDQHGPRPWYRPDWKAMAIAGALMLLVILFIVLKERHLR